ncbi:MAG: TIGR04282 family arsenosugar biosynthesis glycosyltransferase [Chloroflexi bacterium]|nr:TIGR04282 family arsenosugar biosynthesis glycosyltransferase [Chloroflexota bacterium]
MRRALIVVGKAPVAGHTKTRLVPPLSSADAAELYAAFLLDTLSLAHDLGWERVSLIHPRGDGDRLRLLARGVELVEQPGDGLEHALASAFEHHFKLGDEAVILIGSDSPTLGLEPIRAAEAALLRGADLAIGPTVDGGYYLIGMRQPHLGVFEHIAWSTPRVFGQTLERAAHLELKVCSVAQWYDVDGPADLARLQHDLATRRPDVAPHTRAVLEAIDLARAAQAR